MPKILNFVKLFSIIQNYSLVSLGAKGAMKGVGKTVGGSVETVDGAADTVTGPVSGAAEAVTGF